MPAKGGNAKKESGRAKKAENEAKKKDAAAVEAERKEASKWSEGSKGKNNKDDKVDKRAAELARKAENARLLAEEESSGPSKAKAAPKAGAKKKAPAPKPAGPGAIAAGGGLESGGKGKDEEELVQSFSATGIDDAIDLMEAVNAKSDKASLGNQAAKAVDAHPERRFKGALEAYTEREMPKLREEFPGLRLNQYKERIFERFKKSPENPFNQTTIAYDASKEEKVAALNSKRAETEARLRDKGRQL